MVILLTSLINTASSFISKVSHTLYLNSKLQSQSQTTTRVSKFGQAAFGRSLFGVSIIYGSNLFNSRIDTTMELISALQSDTHQINSYIDKSILLSSQITPIIQFNSKLEEVV